MTKLNEALPMFVVDTGGDQIEVPSLVLSYLAWPLPKDSAKREALYTGMCTWLIREHVASDPAWGQTPQWLKPSYACRTDSDHNRDFRGYDLRIEHRIAAGRMAIPFLMEVEADKVPELPEGLKRLSVNGMAALILDDVGMAEASNVKTRVWSPSRPVIHLCAALTSGLQEAERAGVKWASVTAALADRGFLETLLYRAMFFEYYLSASRLAIFPEELIRFRMCEPKVGS